MLNYAPQEYQFEDAIRRNHQAASVATGLSFDDYVGRMSTVERKQGRARRLATPAWVMSDAKVRQVIVHYLERRSALTPKHRASLVVNPAASLLQRANAATQILCSRHNPSLTEAIDRMSREYIALRKSENHDPARLRVLESELRNLDTEMRFNRNAPAYLALILFAYYRNGADSVEVGSSIGFSPRHVRQLLRRLNLVAHKLFGEEPVRYPRWERAKQGAKGKMTIQVEASIPPQAPFECPVAKLVETEVPKPQAVEPAPTQAAVAPTPTLESWLAEARALATTAKCLNWDIGDHINFGKRTFGEDAIVAVRTATGWSRKYVSRVATVCERFPVGTRLPELSFYVYQRLQPFSPEITDKLLPLAAEKKVGARRLYQMAIEMAGEDPAERTKYRRKSVSIPSALYTKLRERATGGTVSKLTQEIIEEWLVGAPIERKASGPRTREWKERVLAS